MNKRAAITDMLVFIVMAIILVVFLATWLYGHNIMTDTLQGITSPVGNTTIDAAVNQTIGEVDEAKNTMLPVISFALIFGMILTILITAYFVRVHPVFIIPYIFFLILAVVVSVYISNAYETIFLTDNDFGATFQTFTASSFILLNLPIWTTIIGFIGIIILFANISRDREISGGIV